MAILKHKGYKSANYFSCQQYYLYEHDEITHKPILDENGHMIPRENVLTAAQNTTWDNWITDCWKVNNKHGQNQNQGDVKTHEYVISFDPRDGNENGLTLEKALEIGQEFAAKNFPGHQALIAAHMPADGNFDVHICINSTRMYDEEKQDFMKKSCEYEAGKKHSCSDKMLAHLKQETMDICQAYGLYQIDLLPERSARPDKISDAEYNQAVRGQRKLDAENAERAANGEPIKTTKYDTQKEELRQAIKETASYSTDYEDFKRNLMQDFGIEVTESRGKIGYIHPDRNKPIRAGKLGADYEKEAIEELLRQQQGQPEKDLTPEERKANYILKYGAWESWKENEYPEIEKLHLPENEVNDYVLQSSHELHTAIRGIAEDKNLPQYQEAAGQHLERLDQTAAELQKRTEPASNSQPGHKDLRQNYIDTMNAAGASLADKIKAAEEIRQINIEEGRKKSAEYRAMEQYGKDTRYVFGYGGQHHKNYKAPVLRDKSDPTQQAFDKAGAEYINIQRTVGNKTLDWHFPIAGGKEDAAYMKELIDPNKRYEILNAQKQVVGTMAGRDMIKYYERQQELEPARKQAEKFSQQHGIQCRRSWKLQQMVDTLAYSRKHGLDLNNTPDKVKEYGRALGAARKEVEAAEKKFEQMKGTANAARDYADTAVFAKRYSSMSEGSEKQKYYSEHKDDIDTFYQAAEVLQKRGIYSEDQVYQYLEDYKKASIDIQKAKRNAEERKQDYIEVCRFRDNIFKINARNGVYLDGFDKQQNRATGRTQTTGNNGRTQSGSDWREVAATAGADSKRKAAPNERGQEKGAGKQPSQRELDRVQREIRGIEQNVAQSAFGHRNEQQTTSSNDRAKAGEPSKDKQQVRGRAATRTRKPGR